jgi:hypothetical protein
MSVVGQTVVPKFTRLGDAGSWQQGQFSTDISWYGDSNALVANFGAILYHLFLGNKVLINLGFQTLAFYGLYRLLTAFDPELRKRLVLLLFLPSFTVWTSVAGKEAVLTFSVSVICAHFVDIYYGRDKLKIIHFVALYLIFTMKPHYLISMIYVFGVSKLSSYARQPALLALAAGLISLPPIYIFRDTIDDLSFEILPHFIGFGRSTREIFWTEQYDVFWRAPYGMYQGFLGPTLQEALVGRNLLHIISYLEGVFLTVVLSFYLFRKIQTLPVYNLVISIFAVFWMLFPNYPFGIMNPGSAIRYRSGYIVFIFFVFSLLMSRSIYENWRRRSRPLFGAAGNGKATTNTAPSGAAGYFERFWTRVVAVKRRRQPSNEADGP